jgi:hypothetical protein
MISATPARVKFKQHLGQANHFLVTTLVALHQLQASDVTTAREYLRTSWNPKDKAASIARTRIFVTQSFLGWAVDSIDLYISLLNRKPKIIQDNNLASALDGAGQSVLRKVRIISEKCDVPPPSRALVDVLITWRNNVFHELADNKIGAESRQALVEYAAFIQENYRGLVVANLAAKAEEGAGLTFKETSSLINAAHNFVEVVDAAVLGFFDQRAFCLEALSDALNARSSRSAFAAKFLTLRGNQRRRFVQNWFRNMFGFATLSQEIIDACSSLRRLERTG